VPLAIAMRPELITFVAGGNDVIRRKMDPARMADAFESAVARMSAAEVDIALFTPADVTIHYRAAQRYLRPRVDFWLELVHRVAKEYDTYLVDLWADDGFRDRRMWSIDRLHLNGAGHRRVAHRVLETLGVVCDPACTEPLPAAEPDRWVSNRRSDLQWARAHLAPWIGRRLTGRSSGDTVTAKRPDLEELLQKH
jgi:hypothetical protein